MSLFVRKISRAKWDLAELTLASADPIPADAITGCLRTRDNTLSLWEIPNLDAIDKAILALSTCSESIEKIDVVFFEKSDIESFSLSVQQTNGTSPVPELNKTHYDLIGMTYGALGQFSKVVVNCIHLENTKLFSRAAVQNILIESIKNGTTDINHLNNKLKEALIKTSAYKELIA